MHFFRMVATNNLNNKNTELIQQRFQQASFSDFDYWDFVAPEPNFNEMVFEERTCQNLIRMLENCLSKSKQTRLHCSKVLVPEKLTRRIAQDVLRLSSTEPCGLRGCIIHVNLETGNVILTNNICHNSSTFRSLTLTSCNLVSS
ncbi:DNA damage-inducible transcript 4-like protein isoform X2 [Pantherophis guttatus]|uniref:DNA damage-inducible transcript 4-like protein n=1 Tax=Pantherophis guttatus TaxID=94885 RepID=A0A6P9E023_PANGU|nr:DNA damage-inducible transcript 4-like protein isoform X2 [Pantherophis guttatus]